MKSAMAAVIRKLESFIEDGEYNGFLSDVYSLNAKTLNSRPLIPGAVNTLEELKSYANRLRVADDPDDRWKYYQLCLGRISALENQAEQAGIF